MKRYSTTIVRCYAPATDPNGEWVRFDDALHLRSALEDACMYIEQCSLTIPEQAKQALEKAKQ